MMATDRRSGLRSGMAGETRLAVVLIRGGVPAGRPGPAGLVRVRPGGGRRSGHVQNLLRFPTGVGQRRATPDPDRFEGVGIRDRRVVTVAVRPGQDGRRGVGTVGRDRFPGGGRCRLGIRRALGVERSELDRRGSGRCVGAGCRVGTGTGIGVGPPGGVEVSGFDGRRTSVGPPLRPASRRRVVGPSERDGVAVVGLPRFVVGRRRDRSLARRFRLLTRRVGPSGIAIGCRIEGLIGRAGVGRGGVGRGSPLPRPGFGEQVGPDLVRGGHDVRRPGIGRGRAVGRIGDHRALLRRGCEPSAATGWLR